MGEVVNLKDGRIKRTSRKFQENGIDTSKVMLCMSAEQFSKVVGKIITTKKPTAEVLQENQDLYLIGYLQEEEGNILLLEPCYQD